jgi:hypothetical protein
MFEYRALHSNKTDILKETLIIKMILLLVCISIHHQTYHLVHNFLDLYNLNNFMTQRLTL